MHPLIFVGVTALAFAAAHGITRKLTAKPQLENPAKEEIEPKREPKPPKHKITKTAPPKEPKESQAEEEPQAQTEPDESGGESEKEEESS